MISENPIAKIKEKQKTIKYQNRKRRNQYFTPEFAVRKALSLIPKTKIKTVIDPAVGKGMFLRMASKVWKGAKLFGVDIDDKLISELQKSKLMNALFLCGDALLQKTWQNNPIIQEMILSRGFDIVVGNPPFSSWFHRIDLPEILSTYNLAYRNGKLMKSQAIEILFLEIFIRLARKKGFIVIVLPDGILSNPRYRYVRKFILNETKVKCIINLPKNVFKDTSAKTSILILQKKKTKDLKYFTRISNLVKSGEINSSLKVSAIELIKRMDFNYYNKFVISSLQKLIKSGIEYKLLKDFVVYCKTGKTLYGSERKFVKKGLKFLHSTHITSVGINYKKDKKFIKPHSKMDFTTAHAQIGDIIVVRVGDGCLGKSAIVGTKADIGVASDCLYITRVTNISPYFITIYLKTKFGKDWINLQRHGFATTCITKEQFLSTPIPVVKKSIQKYVRNRYVEILKRYRKSANYRSKETKIFEDIHKLITYVENKITCGGNYG